MVQSATEIRAELVLRIADSDYEVAACFALMKALRPHLKDSSEFVARWRKQQSQSYELLVAWDGDTPLALAGFRHQENLLHGPHLYVDDLVTVEHARGRNLGTKLMKRLKLEAASQGFRKLVLDAALAVEAQEVVPLQTGSADWGIEVEASMGAVEVVVVQP